MDKAIPTTTNSGVDLSSEVETFNTACFAGNSDSKSKPVQRISYQKVTQQQVKVTRKTQYVFRASPNNAKTITRGPSFKSGSLSKSETNLTDSITNPDNLSVLAESSQQFFASQNSYAVSSRRRGDECELSRSYLRKEIKKQTSDSPVETFVSQLDKDFVLGSLDDIKESKEASDILTSLSETLHRHFSSFCHHTHYSKSIDSEESEETKTAAICESIETRAPESNACCSKVPSWNQCGLIGAETGAGDSILTKEEMARLKSSFYILGRPSVSTESDRKLWRTIFASLNESKHSDDFRSQEKVGDCANVNRCAFPNLSNLVVSEKDPKRNSQEVFRSRQHSKSISTTSSLQEEDAVGFPPADDVISEDDGDVINDVINQAFHSNNNNEAVAANEDDSPVESCSPILKMDDVTSFLIFDESSPMSPVSYQSQKSKSVDNLDGGSPMLNMTPSPTATQGSMNDLLDQTSSHPSPSPRGHKVNGHWANVTCAVKGGPVDALIAYATLNEAQDLFYEAFLTTYRTFIPVEALLSKLVQRYESFRSDASCQSSLRVSKNCFFLFIRVAWEIRSVTEVRKVRDTVSRFRLLLTEFNEFNDAKLLYDFIETKLDQIEAEGCSDVETDCTDTSSQMSPLLNSRQPSSPKVRSLLDFKTRVIAEQLTLLSSKLFQKIDLPEILAWAKEFKEEVMPNVVAFTKHWNKLSNWVATVVLTEPERNQREKLFVKFVKVLKCLFELNNFSSCFAILCGLNMSPVSRLDWPRQSLETLSDYNDLMSPFHHFRNYREALSLSKGPCIPHLAIVLHDLQQIAVMEDNLWCGREDASLHKTFFKSDTCLKQSDQKAVVACVNFSKRWHQYLCLVKLRDSAASHYYFEENRDVQTMFAGFDAALCETELHRLSCNVKPKRT